MPPVDESPASVTAVEYAAPAALTGPKAALPRMNPGGTRYAYNEPAGAISLPCPGAQTDVLNAVSRHAAPSRASVTPTG